MAHYRFDLYDHSNSATDPDGEQQPKQLLTLGKTVYSDSARAELEGTIEVIRYHLINTPLTLKVTLTEEIKSEL